MSIQLETLNKINTLKTSIESVTGGSYDNLTTAVQALKDGYQHYQVFEAAHDWTTGYIGLSNLGVHIIGIEVANQAEREDGTVETFPENAVIKYVEIDFNGNTYRLEDIQELEGRDVWVCYPTANTSLYSDNISDGRVVAALYYYNYNESNSTGLYYEVVSNSLEYGTPIRVYYTTE